MLKEGRRLLGGNAKDQFFTIPDNWIRPSLSGDTDKNQRCFGFIRLLCTCKNRLWLEECEIAANVTFDGMY